MTMTYIKMSCALARHNMYSRCAHSRFASIPGIFCVLAVLAAPSIMMLLIRRRCGGPTACLLSYSCLCTFTSYPPPTPGIDFLAPSPGATPLPTSCHGSCLPILSCLSFLHMCGLGLCPFSGLVCNLPLRGGLGLSPECTLPEEYLGHNLGEHCLEDTGAV